VPAPAPPQLSSVHEDLHATLDEVLVAVLVSLVERDAARAHATLRAFQRVLDAHVRLEEDRVLPLLSALELSGAKNPAHLLPEHRLLERTVAELDAALGALATDAPSARAVVDTLPIAYRLRSVIEHHTARERLLYPMLDAHPDSETLMGALSALQADAAEAVRAASLT
jgi:hypothetical protein